MDEKFHVIKSSFTGFESQRLARCQLLKELLRRRLSGGGWSHGGAQVGTEPAALALLALNSASLPMKDGTALLMTRQTGNGLWCAVGEKTALNFWATAMAVNTLSILGANLAMIAPSLDALVQSRPLEASWLVRLKFRFSDRQVRFDPTKYGWSWVPDTVSWVLPTSMAMIALQRAKKRGMAGGTEVETRLRLGAEMLFSRVCVGGGWNAGNAVVYGVRLRPHIDATAIALAALRLHHQNPIVRDSLTWLLARVDCPSAYSLAWLILAAAAYRDVRADVIPALTAACDVLEGMLIIPVGCSATTMMADIGHKNS